jgi:hypothetical protein
MCHIACLEDAVSVVAFPGQPDPATGATTGMTTMAAVERFLDSITVATTRAGQAGYLGDAVAELILLLPKPARRPVQCRSVVQADRVVAGER